MNVFPLGSACVMLQTSLFNIFVSGFVVVVVIFLALKFLFHFPIKKYPNL